MLATESEARIHAAREAALTSEAALGARQEDARDLRKNHEMAMVELAAEMAEKKRRGKDGVEARLQVRNNMVIWVREEVVCHILWSRTLKQISQGLL